MRAPILDAGTPISVEVEFRRIISFGADQLIDVTNPTVTVTDPAGAAIVEDQAMTHESDGRYSYIIQTTESWEKGIYKVKTEASIGAYSDKTTKKQAFELV